MPKRSVSQTYLCHAPLQRLFINLYLTISLKKSGLFCGYGTLKSCLDVGGTPVPTQTFK